MPDVEDEYGLVTQKRVQFNQKIGEDTEPEM